MGLAWLWSEVVEPGVIHEGLTGLDMHDGFLTLLLGWSGLDRLEGQLVLVCLCVASSCIGLPHTMAVLELRVPEGEMEAAGVLGAWNQTWSTAALPLCSLVGDTVGPQVQIEGGAHRVLLLKGEVPEQL